MPNSRQTSVIDSPSSSRDTNRRRSSITEHSFHGIDTSRPKAESVTHVSGTICHPCLRPVTAAQLRLASQPELARQRRLPDKARQREGGLLELLVTVQSQLRNSVGCCDAV